MIWLLVILLALLSPELIEADTLQDLDNGLNSLSSQIVSKIPIGKRIAVMDFADSEGKIGTFGEILSEELTAYLLKTKKLTVTERPLIKQALKELRMTFSGSIDKATANKLSQYLGLDVICSGTITIMDDSVRVNITLTSANSGVIIDIAEVLIQKEELVRKVFGRRDSTVPPGGPVSIATQFLYPVWYGTNRKPLDPMDSSLGYTSNRDSYTHYGICNVSIPASHGFGSIGSNWLRRFLTFTDDRLKVFSISQLDENNFWQGIRTELNELNLDERIILFYIHGYNVSFEDAVRRAAQIGFDLKVPGITALYSWPSKGTPTGYAADSESIQVSEHRLPSFLYD